jgi:hypothetical protein
VRLFSVLYRYSSAHDNGQSVVSRHATSHTPERNSNKRKERGSALKERSARKKRPRQTADAAPAAAAAGLPRPAVWLCSLQVKYAGQ